MNKNLPVTTFIKLYQTMIRPINLYASEIWGIRFGARGRVMSTSGTINWFLDLDKSANRFYKQILGIAKSAPNSAVFLDLGVTRTHVIILERAISFWLRMLRKPEGSMIHDCLHHQKSMMDSGKRSWLTSIKDILDFSGLSSAFENPPVMDGSFKSVFSVRIRDIALSDLSTEAHGLSSLRYFMRNLQVNSTGDPQNYISLPKRQCRLIAMIRFNMKYSLPFDAQDCCKHCNSFPITSDQRWNHLIYDCETLPPLDRLTIRIPYPYCISILEKELSREIQAPPNHVSNNRAARLLYATSLSVR